jgi:hypothetical protein
MHFLIASLNFKEVRPDEVNNRNVILLHKERRFVCLL